MSRLIVWLLGIGMVAGFASCDSSTGASEGEETTEEITVTEGEETAMARGEDMEQANAMQQAPSTSVREPQGMLISATSFAGIQPGDAISAHGKRLKATVMRNGEGTFDVYAILDENGQQIGYSHPNLKDKKLLGDIIITSPNARTADGIRIGSSYGELRRKYPKIEVHGSEAESRTYAMQGDIYYRLDVANSKYNLDPNSIDDGVKVVEITLSQAQ